MATWISNYLACLGLDIASFEPYISGVLYDENLSEEDKTATIYECLETSCPLENVNLQDAVAELFTQYNQDGLYWLQAPVYQYHADYQQFQTPAVITPPAGSRAIRIVRPDEDASGQQEFTPPYEPLTDRPKDSWARIDDDYEANGAVKDEEAQAQELNGHVPEDRDALDPFDDDEFNPFAPPSASDFEVINETQKYVLPKQYPPPILYGHDLEYDEEEAILDVDMTPMDMLLLIISDTTPEKIEKAFEKAGYDMDTTLDKIMEEKSAVKNPLAQYVPTGDVRSQQTCRHFLQGNCFRKDCWYSHDLDLMICKFWLKGQCFKGDGCEFNHFMDTGRVAESTTTSTAPKQKPPAMDDFDFPSLGATVSKKGQTPWGSKAASTKKTNGHQKENSLKASNDSADSLASQLEEKVKITSPPMLSKPAVSFAATAAAAAAKPVTPLQRTSTATGTEEQRREFNGSMEPTSIPWLETGSAINGHYMEARTKAIEYARARNRCFEKASDAYMKNDRAMATKLSIQGREYNDMMMAVHREASRKIFDARNQTMIKSTTKGETWIDLHGLHKDESLAFLDEFMEKLEIEEYTGMVYVVTGVGNHSAGRAKLKPAVMDWLDSWGYMWQELRLERLKGGIIALKVTDGKA
ncbi:hypothetical protein CPC16_001139 [Podila verticillata]|nr:hypothetical protein BGZ59_010915 [Podila verticillata]KAF9374682.1 hypothetical protein CPC16_001139 [Podila verticillata]KFH64679.1 hypothetical protein MVEG_09411 [Podila verticillata NRRL 6337]